MRVTLLTLAIMCLPAWAKSADDAPSITVQPATVTLHGHRSSQQLLVSRPEAGATLADVTRDATYESLVPSVVIVTSNGQIVPRAHGRAEVVVRLGDQVARVPVEVLDYDRPDPVDFETDVI